MSNVLEVKGLCVSYGGIQAVKDISFVVPKGEVVTLIGANGAGKSSTLRSIVGLVKPTLGSVLLNGKEIAGKTPESIVKKLKRDGYESTIENMRNYINDIAGIRIVCSFTSDIYRLAEMIGKQNDLTVICVKDYIKNPKVSGYKSFHMHVTVPIFLSDRVVETKVEIQIRTIAMDFWASLEHKIYYKFEGHAPEYISRDLRACAEIVSNLDAKMLQLNEAILEEKEKEEQKKKEE